MYHKKTLYDSIIMVIARGRIANVHARFTQNMLCCFLVVIHSVVQLVTQPSTNNLGVHIIIIINK